MSAMSQKERVRYRDRFRGLSSRCGKIIAHGEKLTVVISEAPLSICDVPEPPDRLLENRLHPHSGGIYSSNGCHIFSKNHYSGNVRVRRDFCTIAIEAGKLLSKIPDVVAKAIDLEHDFYPQAGPELIWMRCLLDFCMTQPEDMEETLTERYMEVGRSAIPFIELDHRDQIGLKPPTGYHYHVNDVLSASRCLLDHFVDVLQVEIDKTETANLNRSNGELNISDDPPIEIDGDIESLSRFNEVLFEVEAENTATATTINARIRIKSGAGLRAATLSKILCYLKLRKIYLAPLRKARNKVSGKMR